MCLCISKSMITSENYYDMHILIAFVTGWVNRFANAGDAAMEVAGNTALRVRDCSLICSCQNLLE
jgi:hypothetical protein